MKKIILSSLVVATVSGSLFLSDISVSAKEEKTSIENIEEVPIEVRDVINEYDQVITDGSVTEEADLTVGRLTTYSSVPKTKNYSTWFKRGSVLMWSKDHFNWKVSGSKIVSSSGWQETGWVFPNIVKKKGLTRYSASKSVHKWRAKKTIGAGTVTPWGDVKIYEADFTDHYGLTNTGRGVRY